MHPHVFDPELGAFSHRALRLVGSSGDNDGVDSSRDAPQVVVTGGTLYFLRIGIYGEHLVAPVAQTLEDRIGSMLLRLSRHASHGDSLLCEELGRGFVHRSHLPPPSRVDNRDRLVCIRSHSATLPARASACRAAPQTV